MMKHPKAIVAFGVILDPIKQLLAHAVPLGPGSLLPRIKLHSTPGPFNRTTHTNQTLDTIFKHYTEK